MKKIMLFGCLGIIVILAASSIFIGFHISKAIAGTAIPKDLGIHVTSADAEKSQSKTTVEVIALPDDTPVGQSIRFEGSKPINYSMDSSELTALALYKTKYKYFPFHNVQIRINADNTVEISGLSDTNKAISYATGIGFSPGDVEKAMNEYKIPHSNVSFYVHGSGSVTNGKVSLDIKRGQVAGIPIPMGLVNSKKGSIIGILESGMKNTPGFKAKSISFSDGKVHFDGSLSERELIVQ